MQRLLEDRHRTDMRQTIRLFRASPGFALAVVLTVALGIGATTTMFSLVDALLWRALPFADGNQLVMLYRTARASDGTLDRRRWSYASYGFMRERAQSFELVAAFTGVRVSAGDRDAVEQLDGEFVSADYFAVLRVQAQLGRTFARDEDDAAVGGASVLVLSDAFWRSRFGADPRVIGRAMRMNSVPLTVIGVMPPGFSGLGRNASFWMPQTIAPRITYTEYLTTTQSFMNVVARVRGDVSEEPARDEVGRLGRAAAESFPSSNTRDLVGATMLSLRDARQDHQRNQTTLILFGAVALVLGIACVNLASLLLARASARRKESALRSALGASRWQLVRPLLAESVTLAAIGGALGAFGAAWAVSVLARHLAPRIASARNDWGQLGDLVSPSVDWRALAFSAALTLLVGAIVGALPAFATTRGSLGGDLRAIGAGFTRRASDGATRLTGHAVLVVAEIALALVLLVGASLLLESVAQLTASPSGARADDVLSFWIPAPSARYGGSAEGPPLVDRLLASIQATRGVVSATVSRCTPYMASCARSVVMVEGRATRLGDEPRVGRHYIAPDHFKTMGIPLLAGRTFSADDRPNQPKLAIINETAARRLWPGESPLGKRFWFAEATDPLPKDSVLTVVGVVGDVRYWPLEEPPGIDIYTPYRQFTWPETMAMVRIAEPVATMIPRLRASVRAVDPDLPLADIHTVRERADIATAGPRFTATVLAIFAALAVLLATLGVYGVMSYAVARRTREMGIRLALGATRGAVARGVARDALMLATTGVSIGALGALALTRTLRAMLYGVSATEPRLYVAMSVTMIGVAVGAAMVPAVRAGRVDPLVAMRAE